MRVSMPVVLAALVASPALAEEQVPRTEGVIQSELGYVEVLPEPPPVGETKELPEGWIRVEEAPENEPEGTGSFGVIQSAKLEELLVAQAERPRLDDRLARPPPPRSQPREPRRDEYGRPNGRLREYRMEDRGVSGVAGPAAGEVGPCYEEQEAYAKQLFRIAGIEDVDHPLALLQGLEQAPGLSPWVRLNIFGQATAGPWGGSIDPLRPLAWDDRLQWAADDLEECMRLEMGFDDRLVDPDLERQGQTEPAPPPPAR